MSSIQNLYKRKYTLFFAILIHPSIMLHSYIPFKKVISFKILYFNFNFNCRLISILPIYCIVSLPLSHLLMFPVFCFPLSHSNMFTFVVLKFFVKYVRRINKKDKENKLKIKGKGEDECR